MARRDHMASAKVQAAITTVVGWVAEEGARCGMSTELVRHGRGLIEKAQAPKDAKMAIRWRLTK